MADEIETFQKQDLPNLAFPVLEDIRRQGKLCDVTLKVFLSKLHMINLKSNVKKKRTPVLGHK